MTISLKQKWLETAAGLWCVVDDTVQFADDFPHWNDGFLRLLEINDDQGRELIDHIVRTIYDTKVKLPHQLDVQDRLPGLKKAVAEFFKTSPSNVSRDFATSWCTTYDGTPADTIYSQ